LRLLFDAVTALTRLNRWSFRPTEGREGRKKGEEGGGKGEGRGEERGGRRGE